MDASLKKLHLYRARNLVERLFNTIKRCRRVATRYDMLAAKHLAFVQLAQYAYGCALMSPRPKG
jgi:transposase